MLSALLTMVWGRNPNPGIRDKSSLSLESLSGILGDSLEKKEQLGIFDAPLHNPIFGKAKIISPQKELLVIYKNIVMTIF